MRNTIKQHDKLLDKINEFGEDSLTAIEKEYLSNAAYAPAETKNIAGTGVELLKT